MGKFIDITGMKFNYLTVIEKVKEISSSGANWICRCDCGNIKIVTTSNLKRNAIVSCGCMAYKHKIHANKKYEESYASFRAKSANYKALAKQRNINWELPIDNCISLLKSKCLYCNCEPMNDYSVITRNRLRKDKEYRNIINENLYKIKYNGIDRKDNNIGYTIENSAPCCTKCNTAKLNQDLESFKEWIERLINNYNNWKDKI